MEWLGIGSHIAIKPAASFISVMILQRAIGANSGCVRDPTSSPRQVMSPANPQCANLLTPVRWCVTGVLGKLIFIRRLSPIIPHPFITSLTASNRREVGASAKFATTLTSEASTSPPPSSIIANTSVLVDVLAKLVAKTTSGTPSQSDRIGYLCIAAVPCNVDVGAKLDKTARPATPTLLLPFRSVIEAVGIAAEFDKPGRSATPTASPRVPSAPCSPYAPVLI